MIKPTLAWHFLNEDKKLKYGDNRRIQSGKTYHVKNKDPIELCSNGMHASVKLLDALGYAPGPILCRVEMGADIILGDDKCVASSRKVLWMIDATNIMHEFACECAERALKVANVTDERCWKAIKVKRQWMKNKATDDELDAAHSAARSAARFAARSAARFAARFAAYSAARSAADSAAHSAARSAARSAADSAAHSAARSAARFAARSAARSAARFAAHSAEKEWQQKTLLRMVNKEAKRLGYK